MLDKCPYCDTSYEEILQTGFVGCENCYTEIKQLSDYVASLYYGKKHKGKSAKGGLNGDF